MKLHYLTKQDYVEGEASCRACYKSIRESEAPAEHATARVRQEPLPPE